MFKQVKLYSNEGYNNSKVLKIYGISQNPNTKDYIMVLQSRDYELYCVKCGEKYPNTKYDTKDYIMVLQSRDYELYCVKCGEKYPNTKYEWCRLCQTSENEQIDDFIQEKQLNINW